MHGEKDNKYSQKFYEKELNEFMDKSSQVEELLNYEYYQSCIHPSDADIAIVMRALHYPKDHKIEDWYLDLNGFNDINSHIRRNRRELKMGMLYELDFNQQQVNLLSKIQSLKDKSSEVTAVIGAPAAQVDDTEEASEMLFYGANKLLKDNTQNNFSQVKYAIQLVKLNQGNNTYVTREYNFHWFPYQKKFYLSHCGSYIFYFIIQKTEIVSESNQPAFMVILDVDTLTEYKTVTLPVIDIQQSLTFTDANLIFETNFLYISTQKKETGEDNEGTFIINLADNKVEKTYPRTFSAYSQDNVSQMYSINGFYFKEDEKDFQYVWLSALDDQNIATSHMLYKTKKWEEVEAFLRAELIWSYSLGEEFFVQATHMVHNKEMNQFMIYDTQEEAPTTIRTVFFYISLKKKVGGNSDKIVKSLNTDAMVCAKNCFLRINVNFAYKDGDNVKLCLVSDKNKELTTLKKFSVIDSNHAFDFRLTKENNIVVLGQRDKQGQQNQADTYPEIAVRVIIKNVTNYVSIQEIKAFKVLYPFVFYFVSRTCIHIQSLYNPNKLYRIKINEYFVSFVDFNENDMVLKTCDGYNETMKEHESIAFLTERGGKASINFISFNSFGQSIDFVYTKSKMTIPFQDINIDDIMKVNLLVQKRMEMKETPDFILVYQYHNSIIMKSFFSSFSEQFNNTYRNIQFLHVVASSNQDDYIIFLQKDQLSIQVQYLSFDIESKDYIQKIQEIKTQYPRLFKFHKKCFWIMDDQFRLKKYYLDTNQEESSGQKNQAKGEISQYKFNLLQTNKFCQLDVEEFLTVHQFKNDDDCHFEVSDECMFWGDKVYTFSDVQNHSKNKEFFRAEKLFEHQGIFQGPNKTRNPIFNYYIVKEFKPSSEAAGSDLEEDASPRMKSIMYKRESKREELKAQQIKELNSPAKKRKRQDIKFKKNENIYQEQKSTFYQNENENHDKMAILFTVPVDSNFVQFMYSNTKPGSLYPKIEFSTFLKVGNQERILVYAAKRFFIFSKYGEFITNVKIEEDANDLGIYAFQGTEKKIVCMSDNTEYYLFSKDPRTLQVYQLFKEGRRLYKLVFVNELEISKLTELSTQFNSPSITNNGNVLYFQIYFQTGGRNNGEFSEKQSSSKSTTFSLFNDGFDIMDKKQDFDLISTWMKQDDDELQFGATMVGDYLFVKLCKKPELKTQIEFIKVFNNPTYAIDQPKLVNLNLDKSMSLRAIYQTGRDDLVQLILTDATLGIMYFIVWDIINNIEYSHIQVKFNAKDPDPSVRVVKGLNQKFNYFCAHHYFYDLQFYFPLKFLKSFNRDNVPPLDTKNYNQKNMSKNVSEYLDLISKNTIVYSFTSHSLFYLKQIEGMRSELDSSHISLSKFRLKIKDLTLFHIFQDQKMLQLLYDEVAEASEEKEDANADKESLLNILYPNAKGKSAFDIAIKNKSPKIVEIYLNILINLEHVQSYRFSKFLRKHFFKIAAMNIENFPRYLDTCTYKLLDMDATKPLYWPYVKDMMYFPRNTSYLGQEFYNILTQQSQKSSSSPVKIGAKTEPHDKNEVGQLYTYDEEYEEVKSNAYQESKVEIWGLEFEWIFRGKFSQEFIVMLTETTNEEFFALESVNIIIFFLWGRFFTKIFRIFFIPFSIYLVSFVVYVTYVCEAYKMNPDSSFHNQLDLGFIILELVCIAFFAFFEVRNLYNDRLQYFSSFWNYIDFVSIQLNIAYIICDLVNIDVESQRVMGAAAVLLMWIKFFYYMRIFAPTARFIRLLTQTISDLSTFSFTFILAIFAFGNAFYIMGLNDFDNQYDTLINSGSDTDTIISGLNSIVLFTGGKNYFLHSMLYSFKTGIGAFDTSGFDSQDDYQFLYLLFLFESLLIQIILLNLIVAMMGGTFEAIRDLGEKSMMREFCSMIREHEFIINREKEFKGLKYLMIAKLEKVVEDEDGIDAQILKVNQRFKKMFVNSGKENKQINESIKEEMIEGVKETQTKISSFFDDIFSKMNEMQKLKQ